MYDLLKQVLCEIRTKSHCMVATLSLRNEIVKIQYSLGNSVKSSRQPKNDYNFSTFLCNQCC